jgi:rfaE bifunctional protein kinase chain/domain/rfaE bifunctional protein nucleotidyltransferase chain/domain
MSLDYLYKYKYKIQSAKEIYKKLKKIKSKVILCHGNFDVVHPGHLRHLANAKLKADILVVSITKDKYITKGTYRPHVPENLRALNLAAFEMVDYVIIDQEAKPLKLLQKLKPNFFAKGFEYSGKAMPAATKEEMNVLKSFGGKLIFTPGDIVYSSTKIINELSPEIKLEKLLDLMSINNIDFKSLKNTISDFSNLEVSVIGDTIVDIYTYCSLIGGQIKTPTLSVLKNDVKKFVGGAAVVALHLKAAGAKVKFFTVMGNDPLQKFVVRELKKNKIEVNVILDGTRPTTSKNVFISNNYRLLKVDDLDNQPINQTTLNYLKEKLKKINSDAVIFSDFRHGIFNKKNIIELKNLLGKKIFKVADSQVASRWGNISEFVNFDLITPNEREARFSLAQQDTSISYLSRVLIKECKPKNLILKLGDKGIFSCPVRAKKENQPFTIPSFSNNIVDAVGAGDALLAYATLSMVSSKSLVIASIISSLAASCECELDGNIPITAKDIIRKINFLEKS